MSGPPYPPPPAAGSNAIGEFIIGVSSIGTIAPFNYWSTIISQYSNSDRIDGIIGSFNDAIDQTANMDAFYDDVWNINTAQGWGLDVWGRILGVTRVVTLPGGISYFGFINSTTALGFGQAPFFSGETTTTNYSLSDDQFRTLLFAKALTNISDGSIKSINQILLALFPNQGNCYVVDGMDMTMQYAFQFDLTPVQLAIVKQTGVLPKPTGVSATVSEP